MRRIASLRRELMRQRDLLRLRRQHYPLPAQRHGELRGCMIFCDYRRRHYIGM
ncbi:hypothetical protein KCP74_11535 [Salmonella enterica subsp. enterica]|nr:hypothetical protein KCP74_11535 [Salmonella enterica subsp. enterica]